MSDTEYRRSGARLSDDGRYRYVLWRTWDRSLPVLGFIMLNPSTADAEVNDPTIRRCLSFGARDGYGGIRVANLFPYRATDPKRLLEVAHPPLIRPGHDPFDHVQDCETIVAGWGASVPRRLRWRAAEVADGASRPLHCLGITKDGSPRHPLMVKADQPLLPWEAA